MSQQCIMGQGKLVMVLVQLTFMKQLYNSDHYYAKIKIYDFEIYFRQLENARTASSIFCPISLKLDMDIGNSCLL